MGDNPFSNTPFAAFGGQLARVWQSSLEGWWKALLSDRGRLTELARHLGEAGLSGAGGAGGAASPDDLAKVLEALELMQSRVETLEGQVTTLTDTVASMVSYLEGQPGGAS